MEQGSPHPPSSPPVPLDASARDTLLDIVSHFEGDYWSINRDAEFEGRFDHPMHDAAGNRIPVELRSGRPDFTPNPYSKYGPNPGHVGLSFGFIQFTQDGGSLGALLTKMQSEDSAAFRAIFGSAADELVRVTNLAGPPVVVADPASPTGKARRSPRVAPVEGKDLWESPWTERFVAAGKHPSFQRVQRQVAGDRYLVPMLRQAAMPFHVSSQKGLCVLLDRSVQLGPAGCARLLQFAWGADHADELSEPHRFETLYHRVQDKPWSHRMRKILDGNETSFELRYSIS